MCESESKGKNKNKNKNRISILDCTLRDGGYCNNWMFGRKNIQRIIGALTEAGIDIIECGYLTRKSSRDEDSTRYRTFEDASAVIPADREGAIFVCMVNYGEFDIADVPDCDGKSVDGIRVAFHKKDMIPALEYCAALSAKGYKVFVQAMVSLGYKDEEFRDLIRRVDALSPYAFYIVDSFGVMKRHDLLRLFRIVEDGLGQEIRIGFHSHNNMQLSYSNAQALVDLDAKHDLIIDSSVFGMGRGAGNLNTELFVEYLNDNVGSEYKLKPLLAVIDEVLTPFYQTHYWGYSLPNYLSAKNNAHPDYAGYLDAKKTLTVEAMEDIFTMMDEGKRVEFDREYIDELYLRYMESGRVHEEHLKELTERVFGRDILIIAPGRSSVDEMEKIASRALQDGVVAISVNFDYAHCETDFIFLSNRRRFRELDKSKRQKCIVTSNIPTEDAFLQTKYRDLLDTRAAVRDNAGLMLIRFMIKLGARRVLLAGFDGYSTDPEENYADPGMSLYTDRASFEAKNAGLTDALCELCGEIEIEFVTKPRFIRIKGR